VRPHVLGLLAALPLSACIEDRLSVEIWTQLHSDGSCTRRIEYRLERVDGEKTDVPLPIPPSEDSLRLLHRFPGGEAWTITRESRADTRIVIAEAVSLPSPNDADGDYWRVRAPNAQPARNHVSFAFDQHGEALRYDYSETLLDPASPTEALRALAQALAKREDEFAERWARALPSWDGSRGELRRCFRERLAQPFLREVSALARRPVHGPRERRDLETLLDRFSELQADLLQALAAGSPGAAAGELREALDDVIEAIGDSIQKQSLNAGLPTPLDLSDRRTRIHFRATLVMPGPIVRANTCVQGDTATWEFEQDDLYGRGFEMWASSLTSR